MENGFFVLTLINMALAVSQWCTSHKYVACELVETPPVLRSAVDQKWTTDHIMKDKNVYQSVWAIYGPGCVD